MTTVATIFGAWPLAFASGAGAESRSALGWVIVGGMSFATLLSLFVVPVLYKLLAPYTRPAGLIARRRRELDTRPDVHAGRSPAEQGGRADLAPKGYPRLTLGNPNTGGAGSVDGVVVKIGGRVGR